MTNQERLQQNNDKIEAIQNKLSNKIAGVNLDAELDTQEALLVDLRTKVNELPNKPDNELPNKPDIDLSKTTATADDVVSGKQFYNAQGELVEGGYKDMLQRKVDVTKSCASLFYNFPDEDMSWVNKLDTTGVTTMRDMFSNCINAKRIDVSNFNTENTTTATGMFTSCLALENIDLSDFNMPSNIKNLFYNCGNIEKITISNTSNSNNFDSSFIMCVKLKTIIGELDLINATNVNYVFQYCTALEDVTLKNIKISLSLTDSSKLSNETLINIFKELWDLTGSTTQTLSLHSKIKTNIANIYVKLVEATDDMIANDPYITNKKPCVVCESTDEGAMTLTEYTIGKGWSIA